jgi:hypothetical protein
MRREADRLRQVVEKAHKEDRCTRKSQPPAAGAAGGGKPGGGPQGDDGKKCEQAKAVWQSLEQRATFLESLGTAGQPPSAQAVAARTEADAKRQELKEMGCL